MIVRHVLPDAIRRPIRRDGRPCSRGLRQRSPINRLVALAIGATFGACTVDHVLRIFVFVYPVALPHAFLAGTLRTVGDHGVVVALASVALSAHELHVAALHTVVSNGHL